MSADQSHRDKKKTENIMRQGRSKALQSTDQIHRA